MISGLLTDFEEQLAAFEIETFAEFSHIQEETFVDFSELGKPDNASSSHTELDDSQFVGLDEIIFVELDR